MERLPNFLIIGAMRCGTTSLNGYLRAHPEVAVSTPKEVHFFDMHFDRGLDWYRTHFADAGSAIAVGEATPSYLYQPYAVERLASTLPNAKLIVMLRNPVDRAYSHYWHNRSRGREELDFADAVAAEPERIAAGGDARHVFSYVDRGRYVPQLDHLLSLMRRDQVLVQTFESLNDDPAAVYRTTLEFIGVDPAFQPENLGQRINAYLEFRSPAVRDLAKRLPAPLQKVVAKVNQKPSSTYPTMPAKIRRRLTDEFAAANAGIERYLETDPAWD